MGQGNTKTKYGVSHGVFFLFFGSCTRKLYRRQSTAQGRVMQNANRQSVGLGAPPAAAALRCDGTVAPALYPGRTTKYHQVL